MSNARAGERQGARARVGERIRARVCIHSECRAEQTSECGKVDKISHQKKQPNSAFHVRDIFGVGFGAVFVGHPVRRPNL